MCGCAYKRCREAGISSVSSSLLFFLFSSLVLFSFFFFSSLVFSPVFHPFFIPVHCESSEAFTPPLPPPLSSFVPRHAQPSPASLGNTAR